MADPRFFKSKGPFDLEQLVALTGAILDENADPHKVINDVAPLDRAGPGHLSFFDNVRYKSQFIESKAEACIIAPGMKDSAPAGMTLLLTPTPYKAYALAAQAFYPLEARQGNISEFSHVAADSKIGDGCTIEAGAVIESGAEIGDCCWIEANAVIGAGVVLGKGCRVGAGAAISHSIIGDSVRIYPGCRIGQDGFGFAIDPNGFVKVPQLGRVIIGSNVEIGANTTIDRGAGPDTEIGDGSWIDNLVQIGHNVKIGKGCVLVSQVGISGSTVIDDFVMIGGQAGVAGHLHVGKGAKIGAKSGVMKDVPAGQDVLGAPAVPIKQAMKQFAAIGRLVKNNSKT